MTKRNPLLEVGILLAIAFIIFVGLGEIVMAFLSAMTGKK